MRDSGCLSLLILLAIICFLIQQFGLGTVLIGIFILCLVC